MSNDFSNWWTLGALSVHTMRVELEISDAAEFKVQNKMVKQYSEMLDEQHKNIKYLTFKHESFTSFVLYKHDVVGEVIKSLDKITDPVLLSYVQGKLFGYSASQIIITEH